MNLLLNYWADPFQHTDYICDDDTLDMIYDSTTKGSLLRLALVDSVIARGDIVTWLKRSEHMPPEHLQEVFALIMKTVFPARRAELREGLRDRGKYLEAITELRADAENIGPCLVLK